MKTQLRSPVRRRNENLKMAVNFHDKLQANGNDNCRSEKSD
jgi:hypothetical protein